MEDDLPRRRRSGGRQIKEQSPHVVDRHYASEIGLGNDSDKTAVLHHREATHPVGAHQLEGAGGVIVG